MSCSFVIVQRICFVSSIFDSNGRAIPDRKKNTLRDIATNRVVLAKMF